MIVKFEITGRLPGLNEIVSVNRSNKFYGSVEKKKYTNLCGQYIIASQVPRFLNPIKVNFEWIEPNKKRDLDNITGGTKFILDALVSTGTIPNDTRNWVRSLSHTFPPPDKKNPRIIVTIEEVSA